MESKNLPIKSVSYGNFQFTEWEKPYRDKTIKSFSLACRIYNKDTQKTETQSSIQIDKKQDLSIIKYLIKQAFLGRISDKEERINQYRIAIDTKEDIFRLAKEYKDKNGQTQYSELFIKYKADFLILIDLLERCLAYLIIPIKPKKSENIVTSIVENQEEEFLETDVPF